MAAWEGFSEDSLGRSVAEIARRAKGPDVLPDRVWEALVAYLHEKHGWSKLSRETKSTIRQLAGRGWRLHYIDYGKSRISALHTPNHANLKKTFSSLIGLNNFSNLWGARRWSEESYVTKLDELLTLRHRIAHGAIGDETVGKTKAREAVALVQRLAGWTDKAIEAHLGSMDLVPSRPARLRVRHAA